MVTYLIRRIVAAIVLLFVVSVITFSIFYLVPRFAGATPESLATRYVGRTADVETVQLTAERLGFSTSSQAWLLNSIANQRWAWARSKGGAGMVSPC